MKRIISGKVYDTDTAKRVASWSTGGRNDFSHIEETLFLKKTGEYFLQGEGGPATHYAVSEDENTWISGEKIIPMSYDSAKEWAEKHLDGDEYEAIFGAVTEDDSREELHLKLPRTIMEKLRREMQQTGQTLNALIESRLA